jgi:hypothetical protein
MDRPHKRDQVRICQTNFPHNHECANFQFNVVSMQMLYLVEQQQLMINMLDEALVSYSMVFQLNWDAIIIHVFLCL